MPPADLKPTAILVAELAPTLSELGGVPVDDGGARAALVDGVTTEHDGKLAALPGRRIGVAFASAFTAVSCAVALQRTVGEAAQGGLRLGIDFGEALAGGETLVGDSVYVAARLQA